AGVEGRARPHEQGVLNMFEVIVDTFVVCTLTALAILCSGAMESGLDGAELVCIAGETAFGSLAGKIIAVATAGFAIATALGWSKIGLSAFLYLFKEKSQAVYKLLFILATLFGAVLSLETVWQISDIFNGLMVLPCVSALLVLRKEIVGEFYNRPVEPKPFSPRSVSGK
ncbi:MAG: alanine:cation symporter family protein, partial [Oscillospiraceae bacterium]|nr:alanine:cation symporter family protein [Oscillospiraceae bacterium]